MPAIQHQGGEWMRAKARIPEDERYARKAGEGNVSNPQRGPRDHGG